MGNKNIVDKSFDNYRLRTSEGFTRETLSNEEFKILFLSDEVFRNKWEKDLKSK